MDQFKETGELMLSPREGAMDGNSAASVTSPAGPRRRASDAPSASRAPETLDVALRINGKLEHATVDTRTTLLDLLRENLHLSGTKKGCDHGQCGACTVIVDGRRINSCLTLAIMHQDADVTTVEGLGTSDRLHPMQVAFIKHDGYQCGYCTPGQICSAVSLLDEIKQGMPSHVSADLNAQPLLSADEIRERMSGNICRCGAYSNILDAITDVGAAAADPKKG